MSNQESEFRLALEQLIRSLKMLSMNLETWRGENSAYILVSSLLKTYHNTDQIGSHQLVAPKAEFENFAQKIDMLFSGQITSKLILGLLNDLLSKEIEYPFPDSLIETYYQKIWKTITYYIDTSVEALVPLFKVISYLDDINEEFYLANAIFCSGYPGSLLTRKISILREDEQDYSRTCFLKIKVWGDNEHRKQQLDKEVSSALRVLRFVTMWSVKTVGNEQIYYNPAASVGEREKGYTYAIFHRPEQEDNVEGVVEYFQDRFFFYPQSLQRAREVYRLDDINYLYSQYRYSYLSSYSKGVRDVR